MLKYVFFLLASFVSSNLALADGHEVAVADPAEISFVFNTLLFCIGGFLVMWMAAGFTMLEAGLVRSKNTVVICIKNVGLFSIAGVAYYLIGYNLMYAGVDGGYFGSISIWSSGIGSDSDLIGQDYSPASDWFFQMVFVATTASIVSGALAERVLIWPFFAFITILTAILYPISGSWQWGGGWLSEMGFSDFAGSTIVHSVGGWAALTGAILLGARKGKFDAKGNANIMPGQSIPMATLGVWILWLGWFGFNGASQLALGSYADANAVASIFANTTMAAAGGIIAPMVLSRLVDGKTDIGATLNGAIAGLVSITAEPLTPSIGQAIIIGGIGGILCMYGMKLLDKLKIDDVVGAIPAHLVAGIWGTLIVPFTNADTSYGTQIIGILAFGIFTVITSSIVWSILKVSVGIRASDEDEEYGLDLTETGTSGYPEYVSKK
ncbi:MAG: ammonium transporter [Pseudomonadota bacterium]|nr:ammonium transporter [Pseudomonadota bacterium]